MSAAAPADAAAATDTCLRGKVAIVTGGAGGLGTAVTSCLRAAGAEVLPVDLAGEGCYVADVATPEGNEAMVAEALARHGRLDVLVLNAGVQHRASIETFPVDEWHRLLDVMVTGPFLAIRAAWPHLVREPGGRVVAVASTSGLAAEPLKAGYVTAKHALVGLLKVAALEGAQLGLTANSVAPTWMGTPLIERQVQEQMRLHGESRDAVIERLTEGQPVKRFLDLMEVAETIRFLATPAASGINGSCIPVDLGALAQA
ncbi:MAG TPA: SDR family oxidoreductase [Conexibacter sp.]|nr:SDR family oxidoreductase [Conexibacter sp.]